MADTIKFTDEEQEEILTLRRDVSEILTRLGQLGIEKKKRIVSSKIRYISIFFVSSFGQVP